ncbi:YceI family protein [Allopontixanthobacter sp.]|uniref:YceI family protein n=1 Tax=Allopontixanthobacter sp. TaxID=2906452 RepID=UPI002ABBE681|nr:YceI family protein [Allopontixanthobacter sp.]MDZ4307971.1 YceI family protein [Allopontixanthobacter sp.]
MKTPTLLTAFAAALALGGVATLSAQNSPPQVPGAMDASRVTAGTYAVDPAHTLVGWRANHFGFNDYLGLFGSAEGTLQLDPANVESAKVDISVPVGMVTVASDGLRDHLLRPGKDGAAPDFFGADPVPARFVSTAVRRTGDTTAEITGDLTLNGVTRPVTIDAEFSGAGVNPMNKKETLGFEGSATIKRSEFGVAYGIPLVSDEVELDISAAFEKQ